MLIGRQRPKAGRQVFWSEQTLFGWQFATVTNLRVRLDNKVWGTRDCRQALLRIDRPSNLFRVIKPSFAFPRECQ